MLVLSSQPSFLTCLSAVLPYSDCPFMRRDWNQTDRQTHCICSKIYGGANHSRSSLYLGKGGAFCGDREKVVLETLSPNIQCARPDGWLAKFFGPATFVHLGKRRYKAFWKLGRWLT